MGYFLMGLLCGIFDQGMFRSSKVSFCGLLTYNSLTWVRVLLNLEFIRVQDKLIFLFALCLDQRLFIYITLHNTLLLILMSNLKNIEEPLNMYLIYD